VNFACAIGITEAQEPCLYLTARVRFPHLDFRTASGVGKVFGSFSCFVLFALVAQARLGKGNPLFLGGEEEILA